MNRAIGYIRVSSEEQVDGHSLDNQIDQVKMYCQLYKLDLIDILSDEGISGRKTANRPGFNSLMDKVKNREVDHIIALSFTRFSRNTMDLLQSIDVMTKYNVSFHSITERINTDGAIGKFLTTLFAGLSQFESDQIGDRTKSVKRFCKNAGKPYTKCVFGYDHKYELNALGKRVDSWLEPNEKELAVVAEIFKMREEGKSYQSIATYLNLIGAKTKKGARWYAVSVEVIYKNDIYKIMKSIAA